MPADAEHPLKTSETGGPNATFSTSTPSISDQLTAMTADSRTNTSEALTMAYMELQKAHMRDYKSGSDDRTNAIVLLTDGIPTALSLYANNPNDNALKGAGFSTPSPCTYNPYTPSTKPATIQLAATNAAAHRMYGWFAGSGNEPPYDDTSSTSGQLFGMDLQPSRDATAAHTANWWMGNPKGVEAVPDTNTVGNFANCTGLKNDTTTIRNSSTDLGTIPQYDMYGNALQPAGQPYHYSHLTSNSNNATSIYKQGIELNPANTTNDYHWALACWNATDSAARNILTDANYANRTGDAVDKMKITIYVIGYLGNNGVDDGLLKRIANDPLANGYDKTLPQGMYVAATDRDGLAAAFNKVATALLRLAK